jgi:hypothetical protein
MPGQKNAHVTLGAWANPISGRDKIDEENAPTILLPRLQVQIFYNCLPDLQLHIHGQFQGSHSFGAVTPIRDPV